MPRNWEVMRKCLKFSFLTFSHSGRIRDPYTHFTHKEMRPKGLRGLTKVTWF